ncbi:MAG: sugar ABC transporter permease [Anaerolineae bacterium]|nr:sugar ABC transporter permease [Anaerolineae bacterium]
MGLVVTVLSALILLVPLWTLLRRGSGARVERQAGHFHNVALPYLFLLPTLVFLVMFLYYPAVQILTLSMRRKIFPLPQEKFVCLENYTSLAQDTVYRHSFTSTLTITALIVLFSLSIALGIAVLASQKIKGAAFYRTLLIWPYAISPVVTGVIFLTMFREGGAGLLNWGLGEAFNTSVRWLTDKDIAPWVIVAASVWNLLGFNILFYIAGLQNIPQDLLEAAALDGAGRIRRFWRITFPLLSPFTFFLLVTNITYSFYGIYGVVETLTPQGGPRFGPGGESGATNVLIFKLYKDAFETGAPAGFGAAQAVVLFLMVAGLMVFQFRIIERRVTYEG